ncbi:MAG: 4'-phosphopantetheinyl transferase superfamily protein [Balneolaceae bacterium]
MINSYNEISRSFFPDVLYVGEAKLPEGLVQPEGAVHSVESESGRQLLRLMIDQKFNHAPPVFKTPKYEKPSVRVGNEVISISFTHTKSRVAGVVSGQWVVGIDMESGSREVNEQLSKRMKHPAESLKFYENHPIIQIWTMKEAVLKAIGTGLRKPMNSVCITKNSDYLFSVTLFNGSRAQLCSFQLNDHWTSICYIEPSQSEQLLSDDYVPFQTGRNPNQTG